MRQTLSHMAPISKDLFLICFFYGFETDTSLGISSFLHFIYQFVYYIQEYNVYYVQIEI